jgi:ribosomal protein S18 acetylase RimI-like enzyme
LYQKMGFENVGIRPRFYTAPDEDAVLNVITTTTLDVHLELMQTD